MSKQKNKQHYMSEIDKFLAEFDQSTPYCASQQQEIEKHRRIAHLRDTKTPSAR